MINNCLIKLDGLIEQFATNKNKITIVASGVVNSALSNFNFALPYTTEINGIPILVESTFGCVVCMGRGILKFYRNASYAADLNIGGVGLTLICR